MKRRRKVQPPIFDAEGYQTNIKDLNGTPLPDLSKVQAGSAWGGAREGAGRKSSGRQPVLLRLKPKPSAPSAPPPASRANPTPTSLRSASS